MNQIIGFWKRLYKHVKANIGKVVKIVLMGGLCVACLSLVFGIKINSLFLLGVTFGTLFGTLLMLYGIYRMTKDWE